MMKKTNLFMKLTVITLILTMVFSVTAGADEVFRNKGEENNAETIFLKAPFYDGTVKDEIDALNAVDSIKEQLGGTKDTELVLYDVISNEDGYVYYSFQQAADGIQVYGTSVKLIVNPEGKAIGALSTLSREIELPDDASWDITEEEAEEIVRKETQKLGGEVIPNATEQTLLYLNDGTYFIWVVYTNNYEDDVERQYMAHYVKGTGEYLYCVPVMSPGDIDSRNGSISTLAFQDMEADTWTGTATRLDGTTKEVTVPVMVDPETGITYLADVERQILCADWSSYQDDKTLDVRSSEEGNWIDAELLTYDTFIRVYDLYDSIGWHGPDGAGTPVLLLLNVVGPDGQPEDNSYYSYKENGFQIFNFNDGFGDGECIDVIAHEFTHCVTEAAMIVNLYKNDYGAINEAFSDIMGNLVEMLSGEDPEGFWLFGENQLNGAYRSMKDPHVYEQPAYVWDEFYLPHAIIPTGGNDSGGVHRNSSLLNLLSYKLDQAGMTPQDQFYYWLNVAMAMTSQTDYPMLAVLMPWMMETMGYTDYVPALQEGIEQTRMATITIPESPAPGTGIIRFDMPETDINDYYDVNLVFMSFEDYDASWFTWPEAETGVCAADLAPGAYMVYLQLMPWDNEDMNAKGYMLVSTDGGWLAEDNMDSISEEELLHAIYTLKDGDVIEINTDHLAEFFNSIINESTR